MTIQHRRARLFRNADNFAVRIPKDWGLAANEVDLAFDGRTIVITPLPPLDDLLDAFVGDPVTDDWLDPDDQPAEPVEL